MQSFIDTARITIKAGDGGDGKVSFRHLKYMPKGGPDGGDGGKGGSIYVRANQNLNTLYQFRHKKKYVAVNGEPGGKADKHGSDGQDLYIEVPVGTIMQVIDNNNSAQSSKTIELLTDSQTVLLAEGGRGGRGNRNFATARVQAPRMSTPGIKTASIEVSMELKLLADVGLVGLPNAGKSTLLSMLTSAKPEIGNYPFTTLEPNLGVAAYDGLTVVVADIPGLIEGASQGKGLGDTFLKHVERTSVLLHLISLEPSETPLSRQYEIIRDELMAFNQDLAHKPSIVVLTKNDLVEQHQVESAKQELAKLSGVEVISTTFLGGEGVRQLSGKMVELVSRYRAMTEQKKQVDNDPTPVYDISSLKHTFSTRSR